MHDSVTGLTRRHRAAARTRSLPGRLRQRLRQETGAQTAEYAMLGGVGAAACGALIAIIRDKSTLTRLVEAVFDGLASFVGGWF